MKYFHKALRKYRDYDLLVLITVILILMDLTNMSDHNIIELTTVIEDRDDLLKNSDSNTHKELDRGQLDTGIVGLMKY